LLLVYALPWTIFRDRAIAWRQRSGRRAAADPVWTPHDLALIG